MITLAERWHLTHYVGLLQDLCKISDFSVTGTDYTYVHVNVSHFNSDVYHVLPCYLKPHVHIPMFSVVIMILVSLLIVILVVYLLRNYVKETPPREWI